MHPGRLRVAGRGLDSLHLDRDHVPSVPALVQGDVEGAARHHFPHFRGRQAEAAQLDGRQSIDPVRGREEIPLTRRFGPLPLAWLDPGLDVLGWRRTIFGTSAVLLGHTVRCGQVGPTGHGIQVQPVGAVGIRQVGMDVTDAYVFARRKYTDEPLRTSQPSLQQVLIVGLALDSPLVRAAAERSCRQNGEDERSNSLHLNGHRFSSDIDRIARLSSRESGPRHHGKRPSGSRSCSP
jgi:hypothetical protein